MTSRFSCADFTWPLRRRQHARSRHRLAPVNRGETAARALRRRAPQWAGGGGRNLFAFVGNDPVNRWDFLGLAAETEGNSTLEVNYQNTAPSGTPSWQMKKVRIYVPGPEGVIGAREFDPTAPAGSEEDALVYHYDHLGSIESITPWGDVSTSLALDDTGKSGRFSDDPWGQRRDPLDWIGPPVSTDDGGPDSLTPRGFTGHEMLDELGLVHMNGRIYDPLIGRFLSADIVVQFPGNLQSFNRYSYVQNNPLTFKDPSGHVLETVWDVANIGIGAASFWSNVKSGNVLSAVVDAAGVVVDAAAAVAPCIPGGAGTAIKVARGTAAVASKIEKVASTAEAVQTVASDVASGEVGLSTVTSTVQVAIGAKADAPNVSKLDANDVNTKKLDTVDTKDAPTKGGSEPNKIGKEGQTVSDQLYGPSNNETFEVNGRTRKPDHILAQDVETRQPTIVEEAKNVRYQHMSTQLKDYVALVGPDGKVVLTIPADGKVSKTVENHPQIEVRRDLPPKKKPGEN